MSPVQGGDVECLPAFYHPISSPSSIPAVGIFSLIPIPYLFTGIPITQKNLKKKYKKKKRKGERSITDLVTREQEVVTVAEEKQQSQLPFTNQWRWASEEVEL